MPGRVQIVEDDVLIRRLMVKTLPREGLELDTASDGAEGLRMIRTGAYAVVILDLMLPEMSGFDVLDACAASLPPPHPAFIVTTAFDPAARRELDPALVTAVIAKPFDVLMLAEIVRESARVRVVSGEPADESPQLELPPGQPFETA